MISDILLVIGCAVFSVALRSFRHPVAFRIGTLGLLGTSFLAGWLLGGSISLGIVLAATWLLLPWMEILTRVRTLRLPAERRLAPRTPPSRTAFPGFDELTSEVEDCGFEYLRDMGWEFAGTQQFFRAFNDSKRHMQATICLSEQNDFAFYYIAVTSRTAQGEIFTTWNYPFSYGLQIPPGTVIHRFAGQGGFTAILAEHERFLLTRGVTATIDQDEAGIAATMEREMRSQVSHNIDAGLLTRDGGDQIRYTARGMFYLWYQFLCDLVRL